MEKVAHVNFVAEDAKAKGVDGRLWANVVTDILGGKVCHSKLPSRPSLIAWTRRVARLMEHRVSA